MVNDYFRYGDNSDFWGSGWLVRGELNFPGPFYTAETDTCGTGIIELLNNVIFDDDGAEYVMIQPRIKAELLQLWNAGSVEVFGGYYCDGNEHWTTKLVRDWWASRGDVLERLKDKELIQSNYNQDIRYRYYLENQAAHDLRKYCFFLEKGIYPTTQKLPEID